MCKKQQRGNQWNLNTFQIILSFDFYVLFNKLLDTVLFIVCTSAC